MGRRSRLFVPVLIMVLAGCDALLTSAPPPGNDLESPLDGLTPELEAVFAAGDGNFEDGFSVTRGLGPLFNNVSCAACHPGDGRGVAELSLVRFSRDGDPIPAEGGPQLQDKAIPGALPETLPPAVQTSRRLPPPVFGVGLIEAIPVEAILANADPDDADGDGISGRPHWVSAAAFVPDTEIGGGGGAQLGRFGRKAQVSSLLEQVVEAYHQDMGITSDFRPAELPPPAGLGPLDRVPDPEIPAATVLETVMYVRLLAPPAAGEDTAEVSRGRGLFAQVRCAACHVPSLATGPHPIAALADREVPLYSDLLLHDLGPALADGRPDGDATGSEWRTAPLWGLRVAPDFLAGEIPLLHDGRTTDLHEAIVLHGGEAAGARDAYGALSPADQAALRAFVASR